MASSVSTKITNYLTDPLAQIWGNAGLVNSYNFMLRVEALYDLPCKSVRGFTKQNEYEPIQEGGLNDYVHMLRKPISQPFSFQVERYVGNEMFNPLSNGTELVLPVILYISSHVRDDFTMPMRYYVFTGCHVSGVEYGELNAERSGLHTEVVTIQYKELIVVTNTLENISLLEAHDITKDKTKGPRGNYVMANTTNTYAQTASDVGYTGVSGGDSSSTSYHLRSKEDMEENAAKNKYIWTSDKKSVNGNNTSNIAAQYEDIRNRSGVEEDKSKTDMEKAAKKYAFNNGGVENNTNTDGYVNNTGSIKGYAKDKSKAEMQKAAKGYKFNSNNTENNTNTDGYKTNLKQVKGYQEGKSKDAMEQAAKGYKFNSNNTENHTNTDGYKSNLKQVKGYQEGKTKKEMEEAASGYQFNKGNANWFNTDKYNSNVASIKGYEKPLNGSRMAARAKKYPPHRSAVDVTKFLNGNSNKLQ